MKNEVRFTVPRKDGTRERLVFDNNDIRQLREIRDTALDGRSLDVDTLTAVIESSSENISNFDQKQAVEIMRGGSRIRSYYISSAARAGESAWKLSMVSAMGKLERIGHVGGIYQNVPAGDIIREICEGVSVTVDEPFDSMPLSGWLPYVSPSGAVGAQAGSAKDNLMQVLFAANASVWEGTNGEVVVGNFSAVPQSIVDEDRIFRGGYEIETQQAISDVELVEHAYIAADGEPEELFAGTATEGQRVIFSSPMHSLAATGSITITESGANYAVLGAGTGTLKGVQYSHIERTISAAVTQNATRNTTSVDGATLVGVTNSADVLARLVEFYKCRTIISADVLLSREKPGDVISIYDRFTGSQTLACISKISPATFSQTLRGSITALVGFKPWQQFAATDEMVVLTGNGSWTAPNGVTSLTVVLIGGGSGGGAGADGKDAPQAEVSSSQESYGYTVVYTKIGGAKLPTYGAGGEHGTPGTGGRVLKVTLTVTPETVFEYKCGAGGLGEKKDGTQAAQEGGATTFAGYSSDNGTATGYYDPVTLCEYASEGDPGINGGRGGGYDENGELSPAPTIVVGDTTFYPGSDGESVSRGPAGIYNKDYGSYSASSSGSFGGGAAVGSNGEDGSNGDASATMSYAYARSVKGGNGADSIAPEVAVEPGKGGTGGNGGGGGGSNGIARCRNSVESPAVHDSMGMSIGVDTPAKGGRGSDGGAGADGCVIIYYRVPAAES